MKETLKLFKNRIEIINQYGFQVKIVGETTLIIEGIPEILTGKKYTVALHDIVEGIVHLESVSSIAETVDEILGNIACKSAIKANRKLTITEIEYILRKIESTTNGGICNHGRPTWIELSMKSLDKLFIEVNRSMASKILCITGPTAAGKSKLAMRLCKIKKQNKFQIISMDSAQIYKGVDISSAKPSKKDLLDVPHHLIDICDPTETYSAARFLKDTKKLIKEITDNGGTPLIVGGTMMYLQRLIHGIARVPEIPDNEKVLVENEGKRIGWGRMHEKLIKIDPDAAQK